MAKHRSQPSKNLKVQEALFRFFALPGPRFSSFTSTARRVRNPKGSAIIMASIFMLVATTLITVGTKLVSDASKTGKEKEMYVSLAEDVARAGIVDCLGWFDRQTSSYTGVVFAAYPPSNSNLPPSYTPNEAISINPIYANFDQAFNPISDTADAQTSDTNDVTIGIVNEYPLDDPVTANAIYWAHYEVARQNSAGTNTNAVRDITSLRDAAHVTGDGYVWRVVCTGYVYKRYDKTINPSTGWWKTMYNSAPNTVVASAVYTTEFRKLTLLMPQPTPSNTEQAAIYVQNIASQITLQSVQTTLSGAVSTYGNYAAIGMTYP